MIGTLAATIPDSALALSPRQAAARFAVRHAPRVSHQLDRPREVVLWHPREHTFQLRGGYKTYRVEYVAASQEWHVTVISEERP